MPKGSSTHPSAPFPPRSPPLPTHGAPVLPCPPASILSMSPCITPDALHIWVRLRSQRAPSSPLFIRSPPFQPTPPLPLALSHPFPIVCPRFHASILTLPTTLVPHLPLLLFPIIAGPAASPRLRLPARHAQRGADAGGAAHKLRAAQSKPAHVWGADGTHERAGGQVGVGGWTACEREVV